MFSWQIELDLHREQVAHRNASVIFLSVITDNEAILSHLVGLIQQTLEYLLEADKC